MKRIFKFCSTLFRTVLLILPLILFVQKPVFADCEIRYSGKQSDADTRHLFPVKLLTHLIEKTEPKFGPCKLVEVQPANQIRQQAWLKKNEQIDVAWLPVTDKLNQQLLPVTYPIRKGFLGWRILLTNKENMENLSKVKSFEELDKFSLGFGAAWKDLPVMELNFSSVFTTYSYDSMFEMLKRGRFDFLSRAVYEAYDEIVMFKDKHPNLAIVPNIAIHYPQADFFYVNKSNTQLFERLNEGFKASFRDGSFNLLFYSFYQEYIDAVKMSERRIFELTNPFLPSNVPMEDAELWFQLKIYESLRTELNSKNE